MVLIWSIIGMLCWGISPVFAKMGLQHINPLVGLSIRTIITTGLVFSWMMMNGSISQVRTISSGTFLLLGIEAALATVIGDLAYFAAVKRGSVSMVTTIMASSPLVTIIFATLFLGEVMTLKRFIGSCIVIIGIVLIV